MKVEPSLRVEPVTEGDCDAVGCKGVGAVRIFTEDPLLGEFCTMQLCDACRRRLIYALFLDMEAESVKATISALQSGTGRGGA